MRVFVVVVAIGWLVGSAPARAEGINNLFAGLNGLVTAPADPVMMTLDPPPTFEELPEPVLWSRYPLGFVTGVLFTGYRVFMGAADVALTPFWIFPTLSPEANWDLVPGWEVEWE